MHATVDEYAAQIAKLLRAAVAPRSETVLLADALGRVTASAVQSPVDLPLFRNSQMDGFAVRAAEVMIVPVTLPISGEVSARPSQPPRLAVGTAVRIMTGAVVPEGADAVIPVEDTVVVGDQLTVNRARSVGEYVRDRGSDVRIGDTILDRGLRLAPRHLAVPAAAGIATVDVNARVRVAIITTGSELVSPGSAPTLGQVFDSNATALAAAVASAGAEVASQTHVSDSSDELRETLDSARVDLILTSGGISMGDYEVVRQVLEPLGAWVGHVAMQPGGPQANALYNGTPVVCFPGNPVSTQISFEVFVAPLLREVAGLPQARREWLILENDVTSIQGKRQFLRGRVIAGGRVEVVGGAGSHLVAGLAASDLLIVVPEGVSVLAAGESVETWAL